MTKRLLALPFMLLFVTACVTINIYFPAAAAEEAARTIVRDVLGADEGGGEAEDTDAVPQGERGSSLYPADSVLLVWTGRVLEMLVAPAYAANADININTPAIGKLRRSMAQRQSSLAGFYKSGAIGFDANGTVTIRDMGAVALKDRNRLKKLVSDENEDRDALYAEIARANGHPEWERDVRATFAGVWVQEAPRGYWYQRGGSWKQK